MYNTLIVTELKRSVDGNYSDGDGNDSEDLEAQVNADISDFCTSLRWLKKDGHIVMTVMLIR